MPAVQLLHVTDPHLFADPARRLYGIRTAESFARVLEAALAEGPRPDAVFVSGDIGDDLSAGAYERFRAQVGAIGAPVFCLPGNHDDPALMTRLLGSDGFQYCGRARLGGWGVVLLDTQVAGEPHGRLSADELARFDADMRALADLPVLVCLHHPPLSVGSAWLDSVGLLNAADFLEVLDRHPQARVVLAGHVHQEFDAMRRGVRVLTTPSTCAPFTPRTPDCVMDRRPPGWRRIELHEDGSIVTRVRWLPALLDEPRDESEWRR